MCGIAGMISFKEDMRETAEICSRMQKALLRRGPDQRGVFLSRNAALVHTRLAVIDIEGGRQPMTVAAEGNVYTIVYNGELYNAAEIRHEIGGNEFETTSDTEVVLRSYIRWGEECVQRFNGIFAFAVYDERNRRVFVARDRIGVKPLFYHEGESVFTFASEISAMLENPRIPHEIDTKGVAELLLMAPGRTAGYGIVGGIKEVKAGFCGYYTEAGLELHSYWELRATEHTETFAETVEHTREFVLDSIRRQLVSDVPVCTFLSGGLDSSIISSVAATEMRTHGKILNTFSVDYKDNEKYFAKSRFQPDSDNEYIKIMEDYIGGVHHWTVIDVPELVEALDEAVEARGLPGMADVDASLLLFCREIKKYGTVALSGECADELFGGYPWYRDENIRMTDGFPWAQSTTYRKSFIRDELAKEIDSENYVYSAYRRTADSADRLPADSPLESRMKEMTALNFHWFMQNLLERKDRMSMYSGLEVRVPFCDYRLAEYLYNVPWEFKDYNGREKGLLREAMKDWLPERVLHRKKSPYPKTHNPAFLDAVTVKLRDILSQPSPLTDFVKKDALEQLLTHSEHIAWYGQLMNLPQTIAYFIQLDYWLKKYNIHLK
ncbi:MAG: asparagine synthase (glutamine-hydrolyzing) [Ruminococcus sp.]|nr:asparagine synthase (glutamine-hydrolyzing) [Ruminococcus sp.]